MSHPSHHDTPDDPRGDGDRVADHEPDDLARMRAELAALGAPAMPADVTARIGAALAAAEVRTARRPARAVPGRGAVLAGLVAAAVVAVTAFAVTVGAPAAPRVAGEETDLQAAGAGALGERGAGPLADPLRRRACLTAAGVPGTTAPLIGARPYAVRGEPGTLLVLGTGVRGRFRLVVVDPACGAGTGRLLASTTVGR
ncbi:MAG: hypothetical protein L0I76_31580 [Pseudonocardia sp.]|nr:hypothetical protein [Pseudonocardia sp.]